VPLEKVTDDAHLIDDLGCDSLDALELGVAFEEAFDTTVTDEMIDRWNTVGDLIRTVEGKD
jgi:acyl carrier protein